ncbi:hypothetical protein VOH93_001692 [Clostridium perfringens]
MNYIELKSYLTKNFKKNNFKTLCEYKQFNKIEINVLDEYNIGISIGFPGYKSKINRWGIVYDYRVSLRGIPISHTNIVTDLYNKAIQMPMELKERLYNFLINLAYSGLEVNLNEYNDLLAYQCKAPNDNFLNSIDLYHGDKKYNMKANSWNYSFEELATIIPYIVLQEDINYPMPKLEGRRMSFYRYVEAIIASLRNNYSIEDVIKRTLQHSRPKLWDGYINLYNPIINIAYN